MEIRLAKKDDLYRIAELTRLLAMHMGSYEWKVENHLKHVRRRFNNPRYIHLVAVFDQKVMAFTGAELKSGKSAYMFKGFVEEAYRRKGVMRAMEAKLIEILREKGINKIDLLVDTDNPEGRSTWMALGYKTIRETMRKYI